MRISFPKRLVTKCGGESSPRYAIQLNQHPDASPRIGVYLQLTESEYKTLEKKVRRFGRNAWFGGAYPHDSCLMTGIVSPRFVYPDELKVAWKETRDKIHLHIRRW